MMDIFDEWDTATSGTLWGAQEGVDALALMALVEKRGRAAFIAVDDAGMARMRESLLFCGVDADLIRVFPAWDCLPYDRISPNAALVGQRLHCLSSLIGDSNSCFLLTTVNAWLQRVPPKASLAGGSLSLKAGESVATGRLQDFFTANSYRRVDTVRETGEYALRGGIIDIMPPGHGAGARLDLFGEEIETIKVFDPETQRSSGTMESLELHPINEFGLDEATIGHFRQRYLETFGGEAAGDSLYQSVSEGRHHPGMEHLLPLFHDGLATIKDYLGDMAVLMADEVPALAEKRLKQIEDFHAARIEALEQIAEGDTTWRVLPPDGLYLTREEWQVSWSVLCHKISPFAKPDSESATGFDAGSRRGAIFHTSTAIASDGASEGSTDDTHHSPSKAVAEAAATEAKSGGRVLLAATSEGAMIRMMELIGEHLPAGMDIREIKNITAIKRAGIYASVWALEDGFTLPGLTAITEKDIYGSRMTRPAGKHRRRRGENFLREVSSLATGDLVVHVDHGIGRYEGLEKIETGGAEHDCLALTYAGGDRLFLPVENIDLLSRYGKEGGEAVLDRLGSVAWQTRKARIRGKLRDIADALIKTAALRETSESEIITPDAGSMAEFCQRFGYVETEDQMETIDDVMDNLASGQVMDRLICGDVGYGKTEVALRAAFAVAMAGYQVAVITPTTLLARQHGLTFTERFGGFPVRVGVLSRMTDRKTATQLKKDIASGECQIIIGTHALLSKTIQYNNLGLVIVDEEQHFGVSQKERLKSLRGNIHVLTLSATPIPRTLQMALTGVREMSIIASPPVDRLAVRTSVGPWDPVVLAESIRRERFRGGQVFCVCPRIEQIPRVYDRLAAMVPEARIITAHGQMPPAELDNAMTVFGEGGGDILLSTNIIESGIDIPSANTVIIHRADMFGLAQLYQLRGRVGRARVRAYAHLTTDPGRVLTRNAKRRLQVMQALDALGAGFTLASYDLDIRGAGNLLGDEQSGHVKEVGVELYQDMLRNAVNAAKMGDGREADDDGGAWSPQVNLGATVLIPDDYVADLNVRLALYRRIAAIENEEEINALSAELVDRFGVVPDEVRNLLDTIAIKTLCRRANVERIDAGPKGLSLSFRNNVFPDPDKLIAFISSNHGSVQITGEQRLVAPMTLRINQRAEAAQGLLEKITALLD